MTQEKDIPVASDWQPLIELPSRVKRFHKVIKDGEVVDTLAVMENGQSVSLTVLFGNGATQ